MPGAGHTRRHRGTDDRPAGRRPRDVEERPHRAFPDQGGVAGAGSRNGRASLCRGGPPARAEGAARRTPPPGALRGPARVGGLAVTAGRLPADRRLSELDDRPGPARDYLVQARRDFLDLLVGTARSAVQEGQFRADLDPEQFAYEFWGAMLRASPRIPADAGSARIRARGAGLDALLRAARAGASPVRTSRAVRNTPPEPSVQTVGGRPSMLSLRGIRLANSRTIVRTDDSASAVPGYPWALIRPLELDDGAALRMRPIRPDDEPRLEEPLPSIEPRARSTSASSAPTTGCPTTGTTALPTWTTARGSRSWQSSKQAGGPLLHAVARYEPGEADGTTEIAIVVEDAWQHRGLGTSCSTPCSPRPRPAACTDSPPTSWPTIGRCSAVLTRVAHVRRRDLEAGCPHDQNSSDDSSPGSARLIADGGYEGASALGSGQPGVGVPPAIDGTWRVYDRARHPWRLDRSPTSRWSRSTILARAPS